MGCGADCGGAAGCGCGGTVGKEMGQSQVWLPGHYVVVPSGAANGKYIPVDVWLDCREWLDAFVEVEWTGDNASALTVVLQTTPAFTVDTPDSPSPSPWKDVATVSNFSTNNVQVLKGPASGSVPIMGVLRLRLEASGATVTGL